jgi:hypothetical protein
MSFMLTTEQVEARTKTVTRRLGWWGLKPGDTLLAVDKCMGLRKGEISRVLATIRVESVRREVLAEITAEDVAREGYPGEGPAFFVEKFCGAMKCTPETFINRIEFTYLDERESSDGRL